MNIRTEQTTPDVLVAAIPAPSAAGFRKTTLFRNKEIALQLEFPRKTLPKEKILNHINLIHFKNEKVLIHLYDMRDQTDYLAEALPAPALSDRVTCHWMLPDCEGQFDRLEVRHVLIQRKDGLVAVPVAVKKMSEAELTVKVLEEGIPLTQRKLKRSDGCGVTAVVKQAGIILTGELRDFNAESLRIGLSAAAWDLLPDVHFNAELQLSIAKDSEMIFAGPCLMARIHPEGNRLDLVFKLLDPDSPPAGPRTVRNPRVNMTPAFSAAFRHPFSNKWIERQIADLSNSGFSLCEEIEDSLLMPGMVIDDLVIFNTCCAPMTCKARVVYKRKGQDALKVLCGLAILDMDVESYSRLTNLVNRHLDPHTHVSKSPDMDALWEFFFDTGFLYPEKYQLIEPDRESFKRTYSRLYREGTDLTRHFTYEHNGQIYGHVAMLRAYDRTWLSHHHAARTMRGRMIGLQALKQIIHFLNGLSRLPSQETDFVMAFYQPQKAFPDRVYGEFARLVQDARACSLDLFACLSVPSVNSEPLPDQLTWGSADRQDLFRLEQFYREVSGGLLLNAMGLTRNPVISSELQQRYLRLGLRRDCRAVAIRGGEQTLAIAFLEYADIGINLSEILNCIKLFVINPQDFTWEDLMRTLPHLTSDYQGREVLLLVYPHAYLLAQGVVPQKQYQFWTLSARDHAREFTEYVVKKFRVKYA